MKAADEFDRLVRGAGRYTADLPRAGALHAAFVRSPLPHARIRGIDASAALAIPGVVAVLTGEDTADLSGFPAVAKHPLLPDGALKAPARPAIPADRARYVGEAIALVVAETAAAAADGAEAVDVDYEPLAPVIGPLEGPGFSAAPPLHEACPDNLVMDAAMGDPAASERALAASAHVAEVTIDLPRVLPSPMEPMCARAEYDAASATWDLWTPHQGHPEVQGPLAAVFGVAPATIRVHAIDVGGGFGARVPAYPEHAALMVAAKRTGKPVWWQGTRSETFQTEAHGRGNRLVGRLGLDAEGRFTAIDVAFTADLGAWVTPVGAHIHVKNAPPCLTGCYRIPSACVKVTQGLSSAVPTGPYRGAGRPDIACLIERLVDEAARVARIDRIELRRRNILKAADFPFETPLGGRYDSGDFGGILEAGLKAVDWEGFSARRAASEAAGRYRGIGLGTFVEIAGGGAAPKDETRIALSAADGALTVRAVVTGHSTGQGQASVFSAILAKALGCRQADVSVEASDGSEGLVGSGAFGSRATVAMGWALTAAGGEAKAALVRQAAEQFGVDPEGVSIEDGEVRAAGQRLASLADVVATATQGAAVMEFTGEAPQSESFPSGCHVAEVEIDPDTGVVTLLDYVAVDDAGTILDERLAHAQVHGAVAQGIGEALSERIVHSTDGQIVTSSFLDYAMPRADMLPAFRLAFAGTPSANNPFGAKGVGEAGVAGALVAVTNAVLDALPAGVDRRAVQMPFTPDRVWTALSAAA